MFLPGIVTVSNKLLHDVERKLFKTTIIVQIIFFGYYGYSIYSSISNLVFLIIYSLLLVLSTFSFTHYLVNHHNKAKDDFYSVRFTLRISKYLINGCMLGFNVFHVMRYGGSDIAYGLVILSSISLCIQIGMEFVRSFTTEYVKLYKAAFTNDLGWIQEFLDFDIKTKIYKTVGSPLNRLANQDDELSDDDDEYEKIIETLIGERKTKISGERKQRKKAKRTNEKTKISNDFKAVRKRLVDKVKTKIGSSKNQWVVNLKNENIIDA